MLTEEKWTSPGPPLELGSRWPFCLTYLLREPAPDSVANLLETMTPPAGSRLASLLVPGISGPFKKHPKASFY